MLRRTGFTRKVYTPPPAAPLRPIERRPAMGIAISPLVSCPKREYIRSKPLLAAVRTLPCMHTGLVGQTEPAHSNWSEHGKAGRIKADDNRVAALCRDVHRELDQGKRWTYDERRAIWWAAHCKTVRELLRLGRWPANVPIPDLRGFDA